MMMDPEGKALRQVEESIEKFTKAVKRVKDNYEKQLAEIRETRAELKKHVTEWKRILEAQLEIEPTMTVFKRPTVNKLNRYLKEIDAIEIPEEVT